LEVEEFSFFGVFFSPAGEDFAKEDLLLEYPSLYQPPPLREKEVCEINRWTFPPQKLQVFIGFSVTF
jgi:hypothetical protein